jgi:phosphoglucosamine mutase
VRRGHHDRASPNGLNINEQCGSLYPEVVAQKVRESRADLGISLDGDADRVILVDHHGEVQDGDRIMAVSQNRSPARRGSRGTRWSPP